MYGVIYNVDCGRFSNKAYRFLIACICMSAILSRWFLMVTVEVSYTVTSEHDVVTFHDATNVSQ